MLSVFILSVDHFVLFADSVFISAREVIDPELSSLTNSQARKMNEAMGRVSYGSKAIRFRFAR